MKSDLKDEDRPLTDRKLGDRAFLLPLVGLLLLTPPLAGIFQLDIRVFGIPFTGFYLFGVWAVLIVGAAMLSRRIQKGADWGAEEDIRNRDAVDDSD